MSHYTQQQEQARWKLVARLQARIQVLYGGHCYVGMVSIHGSESSGTTQWVAKWGTTGHSTHCNPFRHTWAHYPNHHHASAADLVYDLICALQEKLRAAEVERLRHGYSTLKQMAADEHALLLKNVVQNT